MKRQALAVGIVVFLGGCAFPNRVHRMAVEYNTAVANMADELTLLNIARAKIGMPLHYTAASRVSGSITVGATAGFNGALKDHGRSHEVDRQTAAGAVTDTVKDILTSGGDTFTPSVGGSISTGPSFDVAVFDTQKFYRGILTPVPPETVAALLDQGLDGDLALHLLVVRIAFALGADVEGYGSKGDLVSYYENSNARPKPLAFENTFPNSKRFENQVECYRLGTGRKDKAATKLAPVSRLLGDQAHPNPLSISDLALLDGDKLDLEGTITTRPEDDAKAFLVRPASSKITVRLEAEDACVDALREAAKREMNPNKVPNAIYLGNGDMLGAKKDGTDLLFKVVPVVTFRSTEGVIRYVGQYLNAPEPVLVGGRRLFSLERTQSLHPVVATTLLRTRYAIAEDANLARNMSVIALIEQLVNLQKEATDKPATVPVQVLP
jgi:hypothetical protein